MPLESTQDKPPLKKIFFRCEFPYTLKMIVQQVTNTYKFGFVNKCIKVGPYLSDVIIDNTEYTCIQIYMKYM